MTSCKLKKVKEKYSIQPEMSIFSLKHTGLVLDLLRERQLKRNVLRSPHIDKEGRVGVMFGGTINKRKYVVKIKT